MADAKSPSIPSPLHWPFANGCPLQADPSCEALHGGRLHAEARARGRALNELLDFSANLNPLGPPKGVMTLLRHAGSELIAAYPDAEAPLLRERLRARHRVGDASLVLGSGSASLLFLALRALAPRRVILPQPCFREQPRAVEACGATCVSWPMPGLRMDLDALSDASKCGGKGDVLLLTNPHNPTGQLLSKTDVMTFISRHPDLGLIVDEAFMDYMPGESLLPQVLDRPNTVILRSLTKFYAMPGLRVGYALADRKTADRMRSLQESWPVGQLELMAAEAALEDQAYEARSLEAFAKDLPAFLSELEDLDLDVCPSRAPFVLVRLSGSGTDLAAALADEGIFIRTCAAWPGLGDHYVRLALRIEDDWQRLCRALHGRLSTSGVTSFW